ncbi:chemotaxis protein CheW [Roseiterribacter gracilis]|uniref:Chemotaxis protein CheW n=1 Tax=Roseiterribacter gracilis TaxID=2812848 RepID=A0A8S8XI29_9PROT|nr:chemotaxis protein CheW [Rhodospirillales bacterium TMPK1]
MAETASIETATARTERRFLTFRLAGRLYALPADEVAEVIHVPHAARLPQSPKSLLGLANLRGAVLPLVSLRALLGQDGAAPAATARAIVLAGEQPIVCKVDAVDALVSVDAARVETATLAGDEGEKLRGAFALQNDAGVAKILDLRGMLEAEFAQLQRPAQTATRGVAATLRRDLAEQRDDRQLLVTFEVRDQEFALPLDAVQEIIVPPDNLALVPRAEAVLLGVIAYRDTLLPLLSLRGLLGFALPDAPTGREKIVVTRVGGVQVGLVADRMRALLRAGSDEIDPTPTMLAARSGGEARIKSIFRGEGGRRLVSVLAPEALFREDVMQRLGDVVPKPQAGAVAQSNSETLQLLVFRLGDEEFGLPISAVDEVARVPDKISKLPKTPKFLEGVVNLRGEVLPVVDQRRRFDLPTMEGGEGRRLIVVRTERHRAGLIVDAVSEVLRWSQDAIEPAPDLTGDTTRLISGVINLEAKSRIVLLLDPAELLSRTERKLLDAFETRTAGEAASS